MASTLLSASTAATGSDGTSSVGGYIRTSAAAAVVGLALENRSMDVLVCTETLEYLYHICILFTTT